jgi:hypothetical protein
MEPTATTAAADPSFAEAFLFWVKLGLPESECAAAECHHQIIENLVLQNLVSFLAD